MGTVTPGPQTGNSLWLKLRKMKGEKEHHIDIAPPQQSTMMAPPQQQYMMAMPPPDYEEAMRGPVPLPGPRDAAPVSQKPLAGLPGLQFGSEPVQLSCSSCHRQIVTDVTSEISSSGWCFAITCCLFGSWLASFLVRCLPGFRRFTHLCPCCRALIGEGEPKHEGKHITLIIFVTILVLGIIGFYIATKL